MQANVASSQPKDFPLASMCSLSTDTRATISSNPCTRNPFFMVMNGFMFFYIVHLFDIIRPYENPERIFNRISVDRILLINNYILQLHE